VDPPDLYSFPTRRSSDLTAVAGWRGLFLVTLPFGLVALVASIFVVPRAAGQRGSGERFDALGAVLSTVALAAAVVALSPDVPVSDRKSTRLNSSHVKISY